MNHKEFAINLASQAGEIITKYFFTDHQMEIKDDQSPVTVADKTINQLVIDAVKKEFPDHGFIGEEGGSFNEKNEYVWICDPLDGTIPFTHAIPMCAFSMALVKDGKPVLGIIYNPFSKRMYFAEEDKGAFLNDKPIRVSNDDTLSRKLVGVCIWNTARYDFNDMFRKLINNGVNFQTGSTVYLGALVASGDAIANIFPHTNPWDFAAVKIVVEEAGGTVTDLFGNDQRYDAETKGGLASNGYVHDQLLGIIKKTI